MRKERILFLCTGNSCRSQMAEGFGKKYLSDRFNVYSAGIEKHGLNEFAVSVMKEIGIDISGQTSTKLDDLDEKEFEYVVTVCGDADRNCPFFPAKTKRIHKGFDDPPKLAADSKTREEKLVHYRRIRDEIKAYILSLQTSGF